MEKEVKKFVKKLKKYKDNSKVEDDSDFEQLISKEKKKNAGISSYEISQKIGISKEKAENLLKKVLESEKKPEKIAKIKEKKRGNFLKKTISKIKIIDKDDRKTLFDFISKIIIIGLPLNYCVWIIFNFPFTYYSWIGWGIGFWFIDKKFIDWIISIKTSK